jgi:hypothetical protein
MIPVARSSARVAKAITERVPDGSPSVTGKVAPVRARPADARMLAAALAVMVVAGISIP